MTLVLQREKELIAMTIRIEDVKKLREKTGIGIMDCKTALIEAEGDIDKATKVLREKGLELSGHKGRDANEGRIEVYLHHSGKVGVLLEVDCNTDFAANSADFRQFARGLAMHIAAARPRYIAAEDVTDAELEEEKEIYRKQLEGQDKPQEIVERIIEGRVKKFYAETCLLKQPFVRDPSQTIEELLAELRSRTGENIVVKRFVRYQIGEE